MKEFQIRSRSVFCSAIDEDVTQSFKYEMANSYAMQGGVLLDTNCSGRNECKRMDCEFADLYGGGVYSEPIPRTL
jgi:hypothetical protein